MILEPGEDELPREEAEKVFSKQREWGELKKTKATLKQCADATRSWLWSNGSNPEPSDKDVEVAWWPLKRPVTKDPVLLETRRVLLRSLAYDYGMTRFLTGLVECGALPKIHPERLDEVLLASSYFGLHQVIAFSQLKMLMPNEYEVLREQKKVNLAETARLFGIEGENRGTHFRLKKLMRFANLGLLSVVPGTGQELEIEIGPTLSLIHI